MGSVGVWVGGCVGAWVWVGGCVGVWVCGCVGVDGWVGGLVVGWLMGGWGRCVGGSVGRWVGGSVGVGGCWWVLVGVCVGSNQPSSNSPQCRSNLLSLV